VNLVGGLRASFKIRELVNTGTVSARKEDLCSLVSLICANGYLQTDFNSQSPCASQMHARFRSEQLTTEP